MLTSLSLSTSDTRDEIVSERGDRNIDPPSVRRGSKLTRQNSIGTPYEPAGHFVLCDCTRGEGLFYLNRALLNVERSPNSEQEESNADLKEDRSVSPGVLLSLGTDDNKDTSHDGCHDSVPTESPFCTHLKQGISFVAGQLEFSLTALPTSITLTLQLFAAAKNGDTDKLESILESGPTAHVTTPHVVVTHTPKTNMNRYSTLSVVSEDAIDVNVTYQPPSLSEEPAFSFGQGLGRRRSSATPLRLVVPMSPSSPGLSHPASQSKSPHRLLLHIAIENRDLKMVKYLLGKGADVSQVSFDQSVIFVLCCVFFFIFALSSEQSTVFKHRCLLGK